ncbi:MAG: TonB-dependent receptor [Polyangiales bacterium]
MLRRRAVVAALASAAWASSAGAQPMPEATVRGDAAAREMRASEDRAGFTTAVDLRDRGRTAESVGAMLDEAPGLHVRRMGDGFAPQSLTLRGAPGAHVTVALDGMVLNDSATDGVDLSLLPPALLERAAVHRGAAPIALGVSGLGGAVELFTRRTPPRATAWGSAGGGSFGARRAGVFVGGRAGRVDTALALGLRGSEGDFDFYDDGGTPLRPGRFNTRRNNASDAIDLLYRACVRVGDEASGSRPCLTLLAGWRRRGVPGIGSIQTEGPFSEQRRVMARVGVPLRAGRWALMLSATGVAREDRFSNTGAVILPATEPFDRRSVTTLTDVMAVARGRFHRWTLDAVLRGRAEGFSPVNDPGGVDASRLSALAGLEATVSLGPLRLVPGVAVDVMTDARAGEHTARALPSPRLGARLALAPWLELRANAHWLQRAPTLPELYGDRGVISGDPSLRPERSVGGDLGAVLSLRGRRGALRVEVVGHARQAEDLIVLVPISRQTFRPRNLDGARVRPGARRPAPPSAARFAECSAGGLGRSAYPCAGVGH